MSLRFEKELAALQRMTPRELREKYAEVFGEQSRSGHKVWLVKRIIWRLQANAEGDLSERARRRAFEIANDADLRVKAPPAKKQTEPTDPVVTAKVSFSTDGRLPLPGTILTRPYKGQDLQVTVLPHGFQWEGEIYASLSAVAKAITGSHTNGFLFFRLQGGGTRA
ncbi:MAG: DUF2924 domain-containing protein [Pirellulaceae bacterium]